MDIQSCKISATKDKSASRSGLAVLAELMRKLGLDAHFERPAPAPGSNRGLRPGAYLVTFMMMHEGSRHLSGGEAASRGEAADGAARHPQAAGRRRFGPVAAAVAAVAPRSRSRSLCL